MRTIFGNPGSNELPFLAGMPDDFDYVLGLHEGVVLGMADGYSQATGRPVFVNLHAASGTGNAMGALTNAHYSHSPLVILAGQQIRSTVGQEAMLSNVDAALLTRPLVKYSHEPLSPIDVPRAVAQAGFEAATAPAGPVYLSVPYDDWSHEAMPDDALLASRSVRTAGALDSQLLAELVETIDSFERPVVVLGPEVDVDRAQDSAVVLAERLGAPVWVAPSPPRCPFPTRHPHFRGVLPPGITSVRQRLEGHDGVIVIGAPVMRYHRWEPGAYLPEGTRVLHLTSDPSEATRAPYGEAIVGHVGAALESLSGAVRDRGVRLEAAPTPVAEHVDGAMTGHQVLEVLNDFVTDSTVYVNETTTLDVDYLSRIVIDQPGMYHFPASGGLGFGLPAAVGISLARPEATVVATVGDGSANYGITALYTAAQRGTRTVFVIVNNSTYGALRGFAARLDALNAPGLDVPGIDFVSLAAGYGVPASRTTTLEEFHSAYSAALQASGPVLIDARVAAP
jgi:benzoylformate decarboxylase